MNQALPVLAPFNPLDKRNLAESITDAMLARPVSTLPPSPFIASMPSTTQALFPCTGKSPKEMQAGSSSSQSMLARPFRQEQEKEDWVWTHNLDRLCITGFLTMQNPSLKHPTLMLRISSAVFLQSMTSGFLSQSLC